MDIKQKDARNVLGENPVGCNQCAYIASIVTSCVSIHSVMEAVGGA